MTFAGIRIGNICASIVRISWFFLFSESQLLFNENVYPFLATPVNCSNRQSMELIKYFIRNSHSFGDWQVVYITWLKGQIIYFKKRSLTKTVGAVQCQLTNNLDAEERPLEQEIPWAFFVSFTCLLHLLHGKKVNCQWWKMHSECSGSSGLDLYWVQ